ncbi:MAG: NAD(P)-dependent oxidoreductase [Pseudanabaena sp. M158S2SP1A06QC]|nr:NAD(P)-dependent oxidoreductase [Pseudanabaena sp. M090S1SP2A07QC]MCA6517391.1 NAD(P)-dependent oxidoreductase [Pseudanabaena sp. M110S1SP2A07QC]MCA6530633.1 NAD(P)-dependent oxidoreductase [Pseudanabaena sp. M125S2SP2A07QC]MCA6533558.1 NAD(P)-dependent oxidoreductase [Pseudanabaena sp. M176S2SP2A07QC]MCA6539808.1 NAD(P)-dependent oxidoreductase [Pseudanabaena sp. M037S2SP2A07QC]MCA6542730.1 NAD(P)-dependent oxidoreductase [Pseudanabaena sp. M074S1SP2A07QC]MCA6550317.1 NAD(P)-dependent oxi
MKIAFIGTGNVSAPLADRLQKLGHQVFIAARDPQSKSVQEATNHNVELIVKSPMEVVQELEVSAFDIKREGRLRRGIQIRKMAK